MKKCKDKIFNPNCTYCRSLQTKWYDKLKKSEFVDVEDTKRDIPVLKKWAADIFRGKTQAEIDARVKYFASARSLLYTFEFDSELHRKVWELHSEGKSQRETAKILYRYKVSKTTVDRILRSIRSAVAELGAIID